LLRQLEPFFVYQKRFVDASVLATPYRCAPVAEHLDELEQVHIVDFLEMLRVMVIHGVMVIQAFLHILLGLLVFWRIVDHLAKVTGILIKIGLLRRKQLRPVVEMATL
jgi:hypothetical protein